MTEEVVAVTVVMQWTGVETRAMRMAMRMSVRTFAGRLGVAVRTVSKWENLGAGTHPRPDMQAILDTMLARCDTEARARFDAAAAGSAPLEHPPAGARTADHETWADDLERAGAAVSAQNFAFASHLLDRWLSRFNPRDLDDTGLHLYARGTALRADVLRDQGAVAGPLSAGHSYSLAQSIYRQLHRGRRVAQLDLALAVIDEMSGRLGTAARRYRDLAHDDRLDRRDRTRALLWVGTAIDKLGHHQHASQVMTTASHVFDELTEPEDWTVAQQKIALAHRGAGHLDLALHHIDLARSGATSPSPLQRVRLDTAYGHVLLTDPGTRSEGTAVLARARDLATTYGMSHQVRSIEAIRRHTGAPARRSSPEDASERAPPAPHHRPAMARRSPDLEVPPPRPAAATL